jgi:hypothetical protein
VSAVEEFDEDDLDEFERNLRGEPMTLKLDLDTLVLGSGSHSSITSGACVMEAVAYVAGEPWSDHPACASKVIGAFLSSWNDTLNDDDRNRLLKPYVTRLVGTAGTAAQEDRRAWMCLDWLVRTYTPAWLRAAKLDTQAAVLAGLPEFEAGMDVPSIRPAVEGVRTDAHAARVAAGDAAWDAARAAARAAAWDAASDAARDAAGAAARAAAWDAAGAAAWDAAWDAARDAAGDAAGDAAWAAARAAAWDAAGDAAGDAAWAAAWDAARDAAGAAAGAAAWDAAWDANGGRLRPVVDELQTSAVDLIDRMIAVTELAS